MNGLLVALFVEALFCYFFFRQCARRPVTRRDLLLIGVGTGLLCGQMIRVWRDEESGIVYQFGGWAYAVALLGLLLVRVAIRIVARQWDVMASAVVLDDAFIGMMIGNFLWRAINVGMRALALLDWQFAALPNPRRLRRARRYM